MGKGYIPSRQQKDKDDKPYVGVTLPLHIQLCGTRERMSVNKHNFSTNDQLL